MATNCSACSTIIRGTVADPIVSAPSLGRGVMHMECAQRVWRGIRVTEPPTRDPIDEVADLAIAAYRNTCCGGGDK